MTSRPVRILVVDEEEPLTHVVSMALGLEGWDVAVARDGASAFELIASGAPDIVLMDVTLPDMRGTEVVAALRAAGSAVPVVFLTGRASLEDPVVLTPMEVEMLRALLDQPGTTLSLGQVLRAVMVRGVRIPREIGVRMLERMRSAVNAGQSPLVRVDARDGWFLAAA